ncbi:MAG: ABC transporter substrate-binding protein, partial [Chloroflexota bacterium]|nr:ABC transporter substrate-binding protein [Chloroflexota bacterium]
MMPDLWSAGLSRRQAVRLLLSGTGMALLAACGSAPAAGPTSTAAQPQSPASANGSATTASAKTGAASSAPKPGGTLQIGTVTDITQLEGHRLQGQNFTMLFPIFDRLTEYDDQLQPQPGLAESWEFSSDAKQLTLHLRKGVQYHTGRELTSDDVKFNILRVRDPKTGAAQMVTMGNWWSDIRTPDASTVILTSDQPRPAAFDFLEYLNIVDPVTLQGPKAQTTLVGTGPFKFVEWVTGDHLTLAKNPNYWQSGKPYLDQVTFRIGHDPQAVLTQLEARALDAMDAPPIEELAQLSRDAAYQVVKNAHPGGYTALLVNTAYPPLDKKEVRQALSYALDRQRYYQTVLKGNGAAQDLAWPSNSPAYEAAKNDRYAFDLSKAKALLASAGVTNTQF